MCLEIQYLIHKGDYERQGGESSTQISDVLQTSIILISLNVFLSFSEKILQTLISLN